MQKIYTTTVAISLLQKQQMEITLLIDEGYEAAIVAIEWNNNNICARYNKAIVPIL